MNVAIIGAGVSGLSCAYELERNGIKPVIFERRSHIGDPLGYASLWSRVLAIPYVDLLYYIKKKYKLHLRPLSRLLKVEMIGPTSSMSAKGNLGYVFKRGEESHSLEKQIASLVKSKVNFDSHIKIEDIIHDFDHIVVAGGTNEIAKNLNVWTDTFISRSRVAIVLGNFKVWSATMWLHAGYAKNAFCYLTPISSKEASLVQIVNGITGRELDFYWKEFLFNEDLKFDIVETRDTEHFCGFVDPHVIGNKIYFVGNAGGFTDDLAGFGAVNAIESGILAARAIAGNLDYNRLVESMCQNIRSLHELRKVMNTFDNAALDRFVTFLGMPVIKQCIYNNPFFKMSQIAPVAKLYNRIKKTPVPDHT